MRRVRWLNRLHMLIHLAIGLIIAGVIVWLTDNSGWHVVPFVVVGSFLPDLDHIAFFFTYGRKTAYAIQVKAHLRRAEFRQVARFWANNHKSLHGLYSHTWYGVLITVIGAGYAWEHSVSAGALFLGMIGHFAFDIVEDVVLTGGINSNWKGKVVKGPTVNQSGDHA